MAFRLVSKKLLGYHGTKLPVRAFGVASISESASPTVFDKLISLTIVDPNGARKKIPAMVGKIKSSFR